MSKIRVTALWLLKNPNFDIVTSVVSSVLNRFSDTYLQSVCGHVKKAVFYSGTGEEVSVDAALVAISNRIPDDAEFRWVRNIQRMRTGFDPTIKPGFKHGKVLTGNKVYEGDTNVIKIGSETGLTTGSIIMEGTCVKQTTESMETPKGKNVEFYNQIEILPEDGMFFNLGDSGSLVFKQIDSEIYCIGMAVGMTSSNTCIVTPIEDIFIKLDLPKNGTFFDFKDIVKAMSTLRL